MFLKSLIGLVRTIRNFSGGTYRPEKHYMRGRGPAWHKKNQPTRSGSGAHDPAHEAADPPNAAIARKPE